MLVTSKDGHVRWIQKNTTLEECSKNTTMKVRRKIDLEVKVFIALCMAVPTAAGKACICTKIKTYT